MITSSSLNESIINTSPVISCDMKKGKIFFKEIELFLKDSNSYGNIYFSTYFEWQGVLRESWFSECIFENMLELEGCFLTKDAYNRYYSSSYPFQKIRGSLTLKNMKKTSFEISMEFYNLNTKKIVAKGTQTIVYTNSTGKITKIPENIRDEMLKYNI
jgi:enediyne core biosynthesis thioesterase